MVIRIDTSKCEGDPKRFWVTDEKTSVKHRDGITWTLALFAQSCGFTRIDPKEGGRGTSVDEVIRRVRIHEEIYGPMLNPSDGPARCFTDEEIRERVGMVTNATPMTKTKFNADAKRRREKQAKEKARVEAYAARQKDAKEL